MFITSSIEDLYIYKTVHENHPPFVSFELGFYENHSMASGSCPERDGEQSISFTLPITLAISIRSSLKCLFSRKKTPSLLGCFLYGSHSTSFSHGSLILSKTSIEGLRGKAEYIS